MRDRIEILTFLQEHLSSVLIPIVTEVGIDFFLELGVDIKTASIRLVPDTANQIEPLLKLLLVVAFALALH